MGTNTNPNQPRVKAGLKGGEWTSVAAGPPAAKPLAGTGPAGLGDAAEKAEFYRLPAEKIREGWIDRTVGSWPRHVYQEHIDADADHTAIGDGVDGDISDNCTLCGLSTTSNGRRHGADAF